MNTIREVKQAFDELISEEGTLQFIAQKTLLSLDRVERLYRLGYPWELLADSPIFELFESARNREPSADGIAPHVTFDAMAQLLAWDLDVKEEKAKAFEEATARGENPDPMPELEWSEAMKQHFRDMARQSGEELSTVHDFVAAEIARLQRLNQLIQKVTHMKAQGMEL